jgi:hypothetical protein
MILRKMYFAAVVAGILEFIVVGLLFLMAGFILTGYFFSTRLAILNFGKDPVQKAELILGIFAVFGFILGLAGSVSALERRRWALSIVGPLTTAFWGVLISFYTLLALTGPEANIGLTIGWVVILLSAVSGLLAIISRPEFLRPKP